MDEKNTSLSIPAQAASLRQFVLGSHMTSLNVSTVPPFSSQVRITYIEIGIIPNFQDFSGFSSKICVKPHSAGAATEKPPISGSSTCVVVLERDVGIDRDDTLHPDDHLGKESGFRAGFDMTRE